MGLHIPPTIASPYRPAAAHRAGWHARLRLLSFLAGHSAKTECDRRALAADYLGGAYGIRSVAQWLYILHFPIALGSPEEGNPLDAFVYFTLILAGLYVLNKRQVSLSEVFHNNGWLMAFLLYCFIAIFGPTFRS